MNIAETKFTNRQMVIQRIVLLWTVVRSAVSTSVHKFLKAGSKGQTAPHPATHTPFTLQNWSMAVSCCKLAIGCRFMTIMKMWSVIRVQHHSELRAQIERSIPWSWMCVHTACVLSESFSRVGSFSRELFLPSAGIWKQKKNNNILSSFAMVSAVLLFDLLGLQWCSLVVILFRVQNCFPLLRPRLVACQQFWIY